MRDEVQPRGQVLADRELHIEGGDETVVGDIEDEEVGTGSDQEVRVDGVGMDRQHRNLQRPKHK